MLVTEVRTRAKTLGIKQANKIRKADLIRTIQRTEGHSDCFGAPWRLECAELDCCWREDCQTSSPG